MILKATNFFFKKVISFKKYIFMFPKPKKKVGVLYTENNLFLKKKSFVMLFIGVA